ncbi:MAG: hypothetical protein K2X81_20000 [Candidatus Obscuribacterales bacterium]|nr:hypothetical protein [Candidatus Obscuribacterales bacterium]
MTEEEHSELVAPTVLKFEETSKYKALQKSSDQEETLSQFAEHFGVKLYYLFYNPSVIPWRISMPVEVLPERKENTIGCRVVPKEVLLKALGNHQSGQSPSYGDLKYLLDGEFAKAPHEAGWRLEYFINDLFTGCREGLIDDSPNFRSMTALLSQKSAPISSALSITFDMD